MHTIRLRGPWEQTPLPDGLARYTRRFHCPTGLEGGERVWLVLEEPSTKAVELNGHPLGTAGGRFDVTPQLLANNVLNATASAGLATDGLALLQIEQVGWDKAAAAAVPRGIYVCAARCARVS